MVVFEEIEGKTGVPGEKTSRSKEENQQQTRDKFKLHVNAEFGNRTGPHWWEASALTTAPLNVTGENPTSQIFKVIEHLPWGI